MVKRVGILGLLLLLLLPGNVSAAGHSSYLYGEEKTPYAAPMPVESAAMFTGISSGAGAFRGLSDIAVDDSGNLYLVDTGNDRIVVLDAGGTFAYAIDSFQYKGADDAFSSPRGLFRTAEGVLYIADSGNARVVVLRPAENGWQAAMVLETPASEVLQDDFYFKPAKVAVDKSNRIFVASEGFNMGVLEFRPNGEFLQYLGASKVAYNPIELLWRRFMTKEQRRKTVSFVPTEYNSVTVDDEGFLFVTTSSYEYWQYEQGNIRPVRRLNGQGTDVLDGSAQAKGDLIYPVRGTYAGPSAFVDACPLEYGSFAALDQKRGRVFAYNESGELLYLFGRPGDALGGLNAPTAMAYWDGMFYVTDGDEVDVFRLTDYGALFREISQAQYTMDAKREEQLWRRLSDANVNGTLAISGLGDAAYRAQNMPLAMAYYRKARDTDGYSKAFAFVRRAWIEQNPLLFAGGILLLAAILAALVFAKRRMMARARPHSPVHAALFATTVMTRPLAGFWDLKREKRGSFKGALIIYGAAGMMMVVSALTTGFLFSRHDLREYNIVLELLKALAAVAVWCVSLWCVTSLMEGEGSLTDIIIAVGYSLGPYILLTPIGILLSNVLTYTEGDLYTIVVTLAIAWSAVLLILGIKQTHDYSMTKTVVVVLITLVVLILILFVVILLLAIYQQIGAFLKDLYDELTL